MPMKRIRLLVLVVATFVLAVPAPGSATPLACAQGCTFWANENGYITTHPEVASGALVTWTTEEATHPTGESNGFESCFNVYVGHHVEVVPVAFDIVGASVIATTAPGTDDATSLPCTRAVPLAGGSFLVRFQCMLHVQMVSAMILSAPLTV